MKYRNVNISRVFLATGISLLIAVSTADAQRGKSSGKGLCSLEVQTYCPKAKKGDRMICMANNMSQFSPECQRRFGAKMLQGTERRRRMREKEKEREENKSNSFTDRAPVKESTTGLASF